MNVPKHDILIVGGGGAGLRAAIAAVELDPNLSVGLVSKVYPMRSHTVSAEGGSAAVLREDDSFDSHAFDTIKGSDFLADQDVVEVFVKEARDELIQLEHWGCPWSRDDDGRISVRAFGGMSVKRTLYAADKTGFHMLHALFQTSLKYDRIQRYDEWFGTRLLLNDNGAACGVAAINVRSGAMQAIPAKAVIICTGGGGRIFPFTTNAAIKTGDGMSMAYRAGCPLKDMEFVQYHPTGLPGTGILMTEASRGEGGYLINNKGDRYLSEYLPDKMELGPRDMVSRAFVHEERAGRVFSGPYGTYVHLDLRHLGEKKIDERIPFVRELTKNYVGIDPVYEPVPVRPVVHYMMGGIHTDITTGRRRFRACTQPGKQPVSPSTGPIASAPTRCPSFWSSVLGPAGMRPSTPRRPRHRRTAAWSRWPTTSGSRLKMRSSKAKAASELPTFARICRKRWSKERASIENRRA